MKNDIVSRFTACVVSALLLITACARPSAVPESRPAEQSQLKLDQPVQNNATDSPRESVPVEQTHQAQEELPQYGGTLVLPQTGFGFGIFDPAATGQLIGVTGALVSQRLIGENWGRSAAGTGEFRLSDMPGSSPDYSVGVLSESWEMPEPGTFVFKLRRGVHWAVNPNSEASRLMSGREVTADDLVASFNYFIQQSRSPVRSYPQLLTSTLKKTGDWEITLRTPEDPLLGYEIFLGVAYHYLLPREVVAKYGNMQDWRNVVGTGPFMLVDFLPDSSATLIRNPAYWEKDPVGPGKGNQLPYVDKVRILVLNEPSTREAAFRTGKIDIIRNLQVTSASSLKQFEPKLMSNRGLPFNPTVLAMRTDKAESPFRDKRLRQALMMATDFNSLKNNFYGADAEILVFPISSVVQRAYVPMKEMPETVKELFSYNPEKAKQLLSAAGYPSGFETSLVIQSTPLGIDLASIYKDMWAKVGISLDIQPKETSAFTPIFYGRAYTGMLAGTALFSSPGYLNLMYFRGNVSTSYVDDPVIEAAYHEIQKYALVNMPEAERLYRDLMPYLVEQAYYIPVPSAYLYNLWWPWVKNHEETVLRLAEYYWIDQKLKEDMTTKK